MLVLRHFRNTVEEVSVFFPVYKQKKTFLNVRAIHFARTKLTAHMFEVKE